MEQNPSWEANRFVAIQESPRILLNPKVHYRIHNPPPPVPILSQPNLVHTPTSYFLKICLNIILSTPGSPQCSLFLRFPNQNPIHVSLLPHPRYMPFPSNSSRFYHPQNIGWGVQVMKLLIIKFSLLPCYLVPLRPKYYPQRSILKHPQPTFLPQCQRPTFTPTQNKCQFIVLYILIFGFLDSNLEDKRFRTEWKQPFNLLLISSWIEFRFVRIVYRYLSSSTLSKELLSIFILWLRPACWSLRHDHVLSFISIYF
jgi:hypothetical protein